MRKITALRQQKKNPERVNVFLDGTFAFGLALEAAAGLRVDQELSEEEIVALQDEDTFFRARAAAVNLLSYRPRSTDEIYQRLKRKGYEEALLERVLAHLENVGLLDDATFARYWIEQRATFKPRSLMALRQELRQKGVSRRIVDKALSEVDEAELARAAAQKRAGRLHGLPYDEFAQKLGRYLQQRGFGYGLVRETVAAAWHELSHEQENS